MKLNKFLPAFVENLTHGIEQKLGKLSRKDIESIDKFLRSEFMRSDWKKVLDIAETTEDPEKLVANMMEDLENDIIPLPPGTLGPGFNKNIVLRAIAQLLIKQLILKTLMGESTTPMGPPPERNLSLQLSQLANFLKKLLIREKKEMRQEEEDGIKTWLASSIIDADSLIKYLKSLERAPEKHDGQYL